MLKKLFFIFLFVIAVLAGVEYGKHYFLFGKISEFLAENNISAKDLRVTFSQTGFRLQADGLQGSGFTASQLRAKIPFASFSTCRVRVLDIESQKARVKHFKAYLNLSRKEIVDIEFYRLTNTTLTFSPKEIFIPEASGKIFLHDSRLDATLFSDKVENENDPLFTVAAAANIAFPYDKDDRSGRVTIRVSNFKSLMNLLTGGKALESWQASLAQSAFGDNVKVPFDIKGQKVFLGPLKIFDLDF